MMRVFLRRIAAVATAALVASLFAPSEGSAQEKRKISFSQPAATTKYTQQHILDVGDVPGHQIRIFEVHRTFPSNPPAFDGVKVKESWTRNISDYTDYTGHNAGYIVFVLENGDKIFAQQEGVFKTTANPDGSRKGTGSAVLKLTGGTGKFQGIRGVLQVSSIADPRAGFNESKVEGEYWLEK